MESRGKTKSGRKREKKETHGKKDRKKGCPNTLKERTRLKRRGPGNKKRKKRE